MTPFLVISQSYMDLHPDYSIRTFEDVNAANAFVEQMKCWSGTVQTKELSPETLILERNRDYWKGYEKSIDDLVHNDCNPEFIKKYDELIK